MSAVNSQEGLTSILREIEQKLEEIEQKLSELYSYVTS
jgi:hypothetical protein